MKNSITLKIPNDSKYIALVEFTIKKLIKELFSKDEIKSINKAIKELIENAIKHAYFELDGEIEIKAHIFEEGVKIDVQDFGLAMSSTKHLSIPLKESDKSGFNKIYNLVDKFDYKNLGKDGKVFSITKYFSKIINFKDIREDSNINEKINLQNLNIRFFQKGDEEAISHLIYHNYGHSYYKDLFYYPQKIFEYENSKIYSIIAEIDNKIIGHFALAKNEDTNIAEIGVAVVHPKYKSMGIMNKMFEKILEKAKELNLWAIYGEALMYHQYSQKSNLSHGLYESCLEIGKVPESIKIRNNELTKYSKRGSVLIGYKILISAKKTIFIPKIYEKEIKDIYDSVIEFDYEIANKTINHQIHSKLSYKLDPFCNVGTIIIDSYGDDFIVKFKKIMGYLLLQHYDMIYADINLETISEINEVVNHLNKGGFFYSGILFFKHQIYDYLHLQYRHSNIIGKDNLICYSKFSNDLYEFIVSDERRVKKYKFSS